MESQDDTDLPTRDPGSDGNDVPTEPAPPTAAAASAPVSSELSVGPQDLSKEWVLQGCEQVKFDGGPRPALGRTVLLAKIGAGGMGTVYFGLNPRLHAEVAVKVLDRAHLERSPGAEQRFLREARLAASVRSPHLVRVFDVDRDETSGLHYLVMEYVHGPSARRWSRSSAGAVVSESDALTVCRAAAEGLAAIHLAGVVHRDVKPDNILIPDDDDGVPLLAEAKLADLGLARLIEQGHSLTGTQSGLGTPGFMAPEQARDAKRAGKSADVFALGATLYALLAGRAPFTGATPMDAMLKTIRGEYTPVRKDRPDVSPATAAVIERCLTVDPAGRFPDAPALCDALDIAISASGLATPAAGAAISRMERLVEASERGKPLEQGDSGRGAARPSTAVRRVAIVAGLGLVGAALAGLGFVLRGRAPEPPPQLPPTAVVVEPAKVSVHGAVPGSVLYLTVDDREYEHPLAESGDVNDFDVPAGRCEARATALGFTEHVEQFELSPGELKDVELPFAEQAGWIAVSGAPPGVRFTFQGMPVTDDVRAEPGPHMLVAELAGYWPLVCPVTVETGAIATPAVGAWEPQAPAGTLLLSWTGDVLFEGVRLGAPRDEPRPSGEQALIDTRDGSATVLVAKDDGPARDRLALGPNATLNALGPRGGSARFELEHGAVEAIVGGGTEIALDQFRITAVDRTGARFSAAIRNAEGGAREIELACLEGEVVAESYPRLEVRVHAGARLVFSHDRDTDMLEFRSAAENTGDIVVTKVVRGGTVGIGVPASAAGRVVASGDVTRVSHLQDSAASSPLRVTHQVGRTSKEVGALTAGQDADISSEGAVDIDDRPHVRVRFLRVTEVVRGPKTDFSKAKLVFRNTDGETVAESSGDADVRLPAGRYEIEVKHSGGSLRVQLRVPASGAELVLPVAVPAGMSFVTHADGRLALLIDTHELSVAKYNEWANSNGARRAAGSPNDAATGISFTDAQRYAAWAGKALPTRAQWTHAAFGAPNARSPRFPWGANPGKPGVHFVGGQSGPGPVDGCPSGASPFGVLNMAGNVWEWLSDAWYIGGGFRDSGTFGGKVAVPSGADWVVDFLRDPIPAPHAYAALSPSDREKYLRYPPRDAAQRVLEQVGLRCVVVLE